MFSFLSRLLFLFAQFCARLASHFRFCTAFHFLPFGNFIEAASLFTPFWYIDFFVIIILSGEQPLYGWLAEAGVSNTVYHGIDHGHY
jgi:hypothetical protein